MTAPGAGADPLDVPDEALRTALELALAFVVAGMRAKPPLPVPPALRPYVKLQKLPTPALSRVRTVVDGDDELRRRLLPVATEELVGRAGWLWLHRPEGWVDSLRDEHRTATARAERETDEREERSARKRLEAAERSARDAAGDAAAARAELQAERQARAELRRELDTVRRRAVRLEEELTGVRRRLERAEAERDRLAAAPAPAGDAAAAVPVPPAVVVDVEAVVAAAVADAVAEAERTADARAREALRDELRAEVERELRAELGRVGASEEHAARAAEAARSAALAAALGQASAALAQVAAVLGAQAVPSQELARDTPCIPAASGAPPVAVPSRVTPPRRVPLPVPQGLFDDDPEVADAFVRVPGVQLVVDGYNVAKAGWPDLALPAQRARLVDALDELAARSGCVAYVVFDGVGEQDRTSSRRSVRVRFTERGVLADDEVVALAQGIPVDKPVVVVSSDRAVRDGARRAGCALLSSAQLLGVLRR